MTNRQYVELFILVALILLGIAVAWVAIFYFGAPWLTDPQLGSGVSGIGIFPTP